MHLSRLIKNSEIQYLGNDAICRCGITILGVRKEALASVPISVLSGKGKEMTRGSAADRLAAEALKNSAETWGVGRYLDEQEFVIRYLWEHMGELDNQMQGEVRRLSEQYKVQAQINKKVETVIVQTGTSSKSFITEGQRKRLWAIAKTELKLTDEQIKAAQKYFGFEKTELVTVEKYDVLIKHLRFLAASTTPNLAQDLYPANNEIIKQLRSHTKHDPNWILAQCKHYGYNRPGMMPAEILEKLVADMCVDWAVGAGVVSDRTKAVTSIQGALVFVNGAGRPILDAALEWLKRHAEVPA